eukprot:2084153-Amphidinium_carterae.1
MRVRMCEVLVRNLLSQTVPFGGEVPCQRENASQRWEGGARYIELPPSNDLGQGAVSLGGADNPPLEGRPNSQGNFTVPSSVRSPRTRERSAGPSEAASWQGGDVQTTNILHHSF